MILDDFTREKLTSLMIFRGLTSSEIDAVAACGEVIHLKSGEKIIEESSASLDLYAVLNGRVSIEITSKKLSSHVERSKRIAIFRSGDVFGDMAFLGSTRRCATVSSMDDFSAAVFNHDKLYGLFEENNRIGYIVVKNLAKVISDRLMELNFIVRGY
jgi:CRP/FNR family cyclic AMP-dependent transcriptional regulator